MKRNLFRVLFLPLLLFLVSNYENGAVEAFQQNKIIASSFNKLLKDVSMQNVRISEIEARDKQQEKEISVLKETEKANKKEIELLKNRVALLEASADSDNVLGGRRIKRPASLLPASLP